MKQKLMKLPVRTLEELWAIEDECPLAFVPDPVHYAAKFGLRLSPSYLKHRRARDAKARRNGRGKQAVGGRA